MNKAKVIAACEIHLQEKLDLLNTEMRSLQEAAKNESKSTAGDKHETGKAMAQLEQENLGKQILQMQQLKQTLDGIDDTPKKQVGLGALVKTNTMLLFVGPALGEMKLEGSSVFCVSTASPLVRQMLGKAAGDAIQFNGRTIQIEMVQ